MWKKIIGLMSSKTASQEPPAVSPQISEKPSENEEFLEMLIAHFQQKPSTPAEERYITEIFDGDWGDLELGVLPELSVRLANTGWRFAQIQRRVIFVYLESRKQRYGDLLKEVRTVSAQNSCLNAELYLTGVCSTLIELDSWLRMWLDPNTEALPDIESAINSHLSDDWSFARYGSSKNGFVFCHAEVESGSHKLRARPKSLSPNPVLH